MTDSRDETLLDTITAVEGGASTDDLFRTLANETRRRLLAVLQTESELPLDELTDILAGAEATDGPVGPETWQQLRIRLVHVHLPMLADAGLVTYEDRTVERDEYPEAVDELLAAVSEYESVPERHARD